MAQYLAEISLIKSCIFQLKFILGRQNLEICAGLCAE